VTVKADVSRSLALEVLLRFEKPGGERLKAERLIQDTLARSQAPCTEQDRAFLQALVMGTLRHWLRLDAWIKQLTGRPLKQIEPVVRVLLRLGLFQLYGFSQVPAYAAINTTVELAKARRVSPKTVKFLNAVLREAQRRLDAGGFEAPEAGMDWSGQVLWRYGWPEAWTQALTAQYGAEAVLAMAQASQVPAGLSLRVNTLTMTPEAYWEQLAQAGYAVEGHPDLPEALHLPEFSGSPRQLLGYEAGWFYVQDPASMWVSRLLNPKPGARVLDLCAAPGSKTTHMAALMRNDGVITALDPKKERLALLSDNLKRLGVHIVETELTDALAWVPDSNNLYDAVLVDAPCSGSGTIRKHPEILLQLRKLSLASYADLQTKLLEKGFACLKPGGVLVYSTCSVFREENQAVVAAFLAAHADATLESEEQRLITNNADGFYAARIRKSE
jgi:16S rRNA (cytosine967-C5)-methyltransferase